MPWRERHATGDATAYGTVPDFLDLTTFGIAFALGISIGEWIIYRTGKKKIGLLAGIIVFLVCIAAFYGLWYLLLQSMPHLQRL